MFILILFRYFIYFHFSYFPSSEHQEAVTVLNCLHILKPAFLIGGLQGVIVNPVYKRNMRQVLCGGYMYVHVHIMLNMTRLHRMYCILVCMYSNH